MSITKFHLVSLNCRYSHSCPALFYLREELNRNIPDCRVRISQLTINDPYYETLLRLAGSSMLFFSVYIWNHASIRRLIGDLARLDSGRSIILGGPQAPYLENLPDQCTVVHGEIEGVDDSFYQDLKDQSLRAVYKATSVKSFCSPYRGDDFPNYLENRYIYYESSRGCPFSCSYCLSATSRGSRHQDVAVVKRELEQIVTHNPRIIKFVDRTFNDKPERALEIWQFLADRPGKTRFHFEIAPDRFTAEMMGFLETVPPDLFQFEVGIQSTNEKTLAAINRRMDVDQALANIGKLVSFDTIHLHADLILGLPYEDAVGFRESFNRVFATGPHHIQMGLLKILPGTPISGDAQKFGLIHCQEPPYEVLATNWLPHRELQELYYFGECVEAFYNNRYFSAIWRYLARKNEEPFQFFQDLLDLCHRHDFFNRAHTQKLMTAILFELLAGRPDKEIVHELLCYNWLGCGYRFLPDYFAINTTGINALRERLRRILPQNLPGLFTYQTRDEFFKKGIFLELSGEALAELGLSTAGRKEYVCFLPEQTTGVIKQNKVVLLGNENTHVAS